MSNKIKKWLLGGVAVGAIMTVLPAMAAESKSNIPAGNELQTEEIIITARRRQESILKVPVVANVVDGTKLEQYSVNNVTDLAARVPGLNLGVGSAQFGTQVSLRGIGTVSNNAAIDQSVSLNVDGLAMTQGLSYSMGFFDMAQVEVLKGPQSLFYGKASPAGVISIRTADPTDKFEAQVRIGYEFEAMNKVTDAFISGPVTDTLLVRLAASYSDARGFFKNVGSAGNVGTVPVLGNVGTFGAVNPTNDRVPNTENTMLRGTVLWNPSSDFKARLKVNWAKIDVQGAGFDMQQGSCPDGTAPTNFFGIRFLSPSEDCHLDRYTRTVAVDPSKFIGVYNNGVPFMWMEQASSTLEMTYNINPTLTLNSLTGYSNVKERNSTNGSVSSFAGPIFVVQGTYSHDDFSQELRLSSDYAGPLNFMVGGLFDERNQNVLNQLPLNRYLGGGYAGWNQHDVKTHSISVFGQLLYKIVPDLELGLGTRWTDETRHHKQFNLQTPGNVGIPVETIFATSPEINSKTWAPELSLTYTPTETLTIFGTLKQAYKSGSFVTSGIPATVDLTKFGDERVRGAEIGTKGTLMDRQVHFSLAGYYYKYKGLQVSANELDATTNTVTLLTRNAAGAKSYGVDFDGTYRPQEIGGLTLNGAVNWNISRYTSFPDAICWGGQTIAQGCNQILNPATGRFTSQDLKGKPLMRAPELTANVGVDYERPIGGNMTLAFGVATQYTSSYYTNILLRDDMHQSGYFKHSANVAVRSEKGWELALIGNNLGNKIVTGNCTNASNQDAFLVPLVTGAATQNAAGSEELICAPEPGRSLMLRLTMKLQ